MRIRPPGRLTERASRGAGVAEDHVTRLLNALAEGEQAVHDQLIAALYPELRRLAQAQMRKERAGHTLQPTALVNEAYLRLVQGDVRWQNRAHFFGAAAEAMRRILVDHARKHRAEKRGGDQQRVTFSDIDVIGSHQDLDVLDIDAALSGLEEEDARLAEVVKLRYFVGLTVEEIAEVLNLSPATIKRDWTYARAWLFDHMQDPEPLDD